jgi:hypothetical protein
LEIPLTFQLESAEKDKLEKFKQYFEIQSRYASGWSDPNANDSSFQIVAAASGIVVHNSSDGFWFIPNADLENWKNVNLGEDTQLREGLSKDWCSRSTSFCNCGLASFR